VDSRLFLVTQFKANRFVAHLDQMEELMVGRSSRILVLAALIATSWSITHAEAVPLLQVDFGSALPNSPLQPGFQGMWGTNDQPTTAALGAFTVQLQADSSMTGTPSSRGFFTKLGGRIDSVDPSIRNFYTDFFFNRSTINGEGIDLKISGLTPNVPYNLSVVSFDADASLTSVVAQNWGPKVGSDTTGTSTTINMLREPVPTTLWDPLYTGTIQVSTTTGILDIFGTTSSGSRGAVLNGFKLNDGTNDVLQVDLGEGAEASVVPGFYHLSGPHFDVSASDGGSETFGAYTVSVERIGGNFGDSGFYNEYAVRMGGEILPPATHNMFRDCFCNVSINEGEGVLLTIEGVTPDTEYDLTIWDMDPANPNATPTTWSPVIDTTGEIGNVVSIRTPVPQDIYDPAHLTTIRVQSTGTSLQIFGTTTSGFGGVRLNAFELNAVPDEISGDFNLDGTVDAADYVVWRKTDGAPGPYNDEWVPNFGNSSNGSGGGRESVPEPASAGLALLCVFAIAAAIRRRGVLAVECGG
jgi:hypothetical protein